MINQEELTRYKRQLILPEFGLAAQEKLKQAKVFVAGAGGLGGPVSIYLAAAGVGHLIIADRDKVELSNLNRQILHTTKDIGAAKADSTKQSLSELNPDIRVETHTISIEDETINTLAKGADIIVDCLDNISTRHVLNRFSIKNNVPIMHAGIDNWNGQLTLLQPPKTACVNCLFEGSMDTEETKPVLGAVVGVVGTIQALETIKFLTGKSNLENSLIHFDGLSLEWTKLEIRKNTNCPVCGKF